MVRDDRIMVDANTSVWPHEMDTARALAQKGRHVRFLRRIEGEKVKTPDIVMDGVAWEMKAPTSSSVRSLQKVLRRAGKQSHNVIVDVARMKGVSDRAAERELRRLLPLVASVHQVILVGKDRDVIDIR